MKILLTGASGLIGSALIHYFEKAGHDVTRLVRRPAHKNEIIWDPLKKKVDPTRLEGFDTVIHLAGENISTGRWTKFKKDKILRSRKIGTRFLADVLSQLQRPPASFLSASAIGYYGSQGLTVLNEDSPKGNLFISDVCDEWEKATIPAKEKGIRVVNLRIGIVLSNRGGALKKMLLPFKLGLGGVIGSGSQYMSWISLLDLCRAIAHAVRTPGVQGPINFVSPDPCTNHLFTKKLGKALRRKTIFPIPAFAAKLIFGQMAEELLLSSALIQPVALLKSGFQFKHPRIEDAFEFYLKK